MYMSVRVCLHLFVYEIDLPLQLHVYLTFFIKKNTCMHNLRGFFSFLLDINTTFLHKGTNVFTVKQINYIQIHVHLKFIILLINFFFRKMLFMNIDIIYIFHFLKYTVLDV